MGLGALLAILWHILRWPVSTGLLVVAQAVVYAEAPEVALACQGLTPRAVCAVLAPLWGAENETCKIPDESG
jgi:hypothetical protein